MPRSVRRRSNKRVRVKRVNKNRSRRLGRSSSSKRVNRSRSRRRRRRTMRGGACVHTVTKEIVPKELNVQAGFLDMNPDYECFLSEQKALESIGRIGKTEFARRMAVFEKNNV